MINRERFTIPCTDGLAPGDLILWREDVYVGGWPGQEAKCMGHRWNSGMVFWANWDAARDEVIYRLLVFRSETDCGQLIPPHTFIFAEWSSRIASERIKAAQAILRQQGRPTGGRRPFGYRVVEEDGQRLLQPDWNERAILLEIIRAVEIAGIVAWDKVSRIARRAADRVYAAEPDAPRRSWSETTVRRAVDGFWRLARADGIDWIRDPALKGLAMVRPAQATSQRSKEFPD